ncbi:MAG: metallophosphoesterase [Bacteroidales bacterium]|nr:metallophosphoesterase [Bacteroidales bacterium]
MKTNIKIIIAAALATVSFSACNRLDIGGMFFSGGSHTEARVARWLEWNEAHGDNVISGVPDSYSFYACSDVHVTDNPERVAKFLIDERTDPSAQFSIIMGDLANESGEEPFRQINRVITGNGATGPNPTRHDTCFCIIGNHDIYFDCEEYYEKYFHTSTYTLTVETVSGAKDLFIFLDSGNATHGRRQTDWLRQVLEQRSEYRNCVVCTHTCLFRNSYDYSTTPAASLPQEECYELLDMMSENNVNLFMMGHFHHRESHEIGGVKYVMTDNLNEEAETPSYLVVNCSNSGVDYRYQDLVNF